MMIRRECGEDDLVRNAKTRPAYVGAVDWVKVWRDLVGGRRERIEALGVYRPQ